jgi:hypothetical protein
LKNRKKRPAKQRDGLRRRRRGRKGGYARVRKPGAVENGKKENFVLVAGFPRGSAWLPLWDFARE